MATNESLKQDGEIDSPMFWLHYALSCSLQAVELEKQSRRAYRGITPTVACRAMQAGASALWRQADDYWLSFCREG